MILQSTGTYEDQYRRAYRSELNNHDFNYIVETLQSSKNVTAEGIAGLTNQFIKPSATPEAMVYVPNGWDTQRLRFFLEIESKDFMGIVTSEYIVGYTDYHGVSHSLHLDPDMLFYMNAIHTTRRIITQTPIGNQVYNNLLDSSHVLVNDKYIGITDKTNKQFGLRPEDIFSKMDTASLMRNLGEEDHIAIDGTGLVTSNAIKSKRINNSATAYTASIIDTYLKARKADGDIVDASQIRSTSGSILESQHVLKDPFMSHLRKRRSGIYGVAQNLSAFTLKDLQEYDSNSLNCIHVVPVDNSSYINNLHRRGSTTPWNGSDAATLFATCIVQSVPSYMLEFSLGKIQFVSTNMDIGSQIHTRIGHVRSFSDNDVSNLIEAFVFKIENQLLKSLSYNNQMSFMLDVSCDLLGETWVKISLNGQAMVDYVCPSFSDALIAPIVTNDENNVFTIASDFDNILSNISDSSFSTPINGNGHGFNSFGNSNHIYTPVI